MIVSKKTCLELLMVAFFSCGVANHAHAQGQDEIITVAAERSLEDFAILESEGRYFESVLTSEIGEWVAPWTYQVIVEEREWECVAGLGELFNKLARESAFSRHAKSEDVFAQGTITPYLMSRPPRRAKGRKRYSNHDWGFVGFLDQMGGIAHKDVVRLSAGGATTRIVDGVRTSMIEIRMNLIVDYDADSRCLTIHLRPVNLDADAPLQPDSAYPYFRISNLPIGVRVFGRVVETSLVESINASLAFPTLGGGSVYSYTVNRDRWDMNIGVNDACVAEFGRIALERQTVGGDVFWNLRLGSTITPRFDALVDEHVATATSQSCSTTRVVNSSVTIGTRNIEDSSFTYDETSVSTCVSEAWTAVGSMDFKIKNSYGYGIAGDMVLTVRKKGRNRAVSWIRPEFATDLFYTCVATVSNVSDDTQLVPVDLVSNGGQPKLPTKKALKTKF